MMLSKHQVGEPYSSLDGGSEGGLSESRLLSCPAFVGRVEI